MDRNRDTQEAARAVGGAGPTGYGMEQLIPVINKLQDVFNAVGGDIQIDLPQIVVVGSQSSGKSSVLENIVGRDFLPRGSGIVTRRPLILQLINIPKGKAKKDPRFEEWGEFLHKPNEVFYDFNKIRQEIEAETDRMTGRNKGISPNPIRLRIWSPYVLNLTLVDLPGITRVPVGDQPMDIEDQIRRMVLTYIEKPNAIILAVTAANTDIANSDAIRLASDVDPEGSRTIGVLTKIDIMDKGTDALDMLLGRVISLRLGFVGVINRSQQDIIQKKPIRDAVKAETEFFSTHPLYRSIASRLGTPYLARTMNKILMQHIRDTLPDLKAKINKMLNEAQIEMRTYGDSMFDSRKSQGALLLQILTRFSADYRDAIDGKLGSLQVNELYGGARINYIFTEIFNKCLHTILPHEGLTLNDIRTAIMNATGPRAALFVPEESFEQLVKRQISRLEEPALQCVELVFDELQRIVTQLESKELLRFSVLREKVVEVVNELLVNCKMPSRKMISNLIAIELAYINTNHPDFVGGGGAISKIFEKMARQDQAQQQQQQQQQLPPQQQQPGQQQRPGQPRPGQNPQQQQMQQQQMQQQQMQQNPHGSAGQQGQGQNGFFNRFFSQQQQPGGGPPQPQQPQRAQQQQQQQRQPQQQRMQQHRGMMDDSSAIERLDNVPSTIKAARPTTDKERFETELIQNLLSSYFDIVRKNIQDTVPKSIMYFLVNESKETIQNELVRNLYKEELFDDLLEENPQIAQRRKACKETLETLKKAQHVLNELRDFNINASRSTALPTRE